jgi:hypothetical protein
MGEGGGCEGEGGSGKGGVSDRNSSASKKSLKGFVIVLCLP